MMKSFTRTAMFCLIAVCLTVLSACRVDKAYDLGNVNGSMHLAEEIQLPDNHSTTSVFEVFGDALSRKLGIEKEVLLQNWPTFEVSLPDGDINIQYILNSEIPSDLIERLDENYNSIMLETIINNNIPADFSIGINFISSTERSFNFDRMNVSALQQGFSFIEVFPFDRFDILMNLAEVNFSFDYSFPASVVLAEDANIEITFRITIDGGIEI